MSLPADVKMIRLGHTIGKNPRPLKVIFSSKITSQQFIKDLVTGMRSRAATDPPLLVSVVRDRTLMERQQVSHVYADLEQRRKNGENNIVVRHFNGVPSIVQANKDFQLNHSRSSSCHPCKKLTSLNHPGTCGDVNQSSSYLIDPQCFCMVPLASCYLCKPSVNTFTDFFDFLNRFKNNNHLNCNLNSLNIFYQNARGLKTKLSNFRSSNPLFICYDVIVKEDGGCSVKDLSTSVDDETFWTFEMPLDLRCI
ncbi:Uncharacterized protein FWK35_00024588 [Aphis craccivora]|uniref:Uncharacterized protein n=1 Tax=Aphis craccivora TaxID=307492 RepID=A0A6G0Y019_APHCR|nr:Uncharacterized protein FWK35_00024588 [Aphis craccivora]